MLDRHTHRVRRPRLRSRPLPQRALDDLRYIRETMERSSAFTATPGWGQVLMGLTALVAASVASRRSISQAWLAVWLAEAFLAVAIAIAAIFRKARRAGLPVTSGPGRKFALGFLPCVLWRAANRRPDAPGPDSLAARPWLLLYGAGVSDRRSFLDSARPRHGRQLPRGRNPRPLPACLGQHTHGRRFRRPAHSFRRLDRSEVWRLRQNSRTRSAK